MKVYAAIVISFTLIQTTFAQPCDSIKLKIIASDTLVCAGDEIFLRAEIQGTDKTPQYIWSTNIDGSRTSLTPKVNTTVGLSAFLDGCPDTFKSTIIIRVINLDFNLNIDRYRGYINYRNWISNQVEVSFKVYLNKIECDSCYKVLDQQTLVFKHKGEYEVVFTFRRQDCVGYDTVLISVNETFGFYPGIPNTIILEGKNPLNSQFKPYTDFFEFYTLAVFSQRGNRVYYCEGLDCFWDGIDKNGAYVPDDNYYYIIKAKTIFGQEKVFNGLVKVLR